MEIDSSIANVESRSQSLKKDVIIFSYLGELFKFVRKNKKSSLLYKLKNQNTGEVITMSYEDTQDLFNELNEKGMFGI